MPILSSYNDIRNYVRTILHLSKRMCCLSHLSSLPFTRSVDSTIGCKLLD